MFSSAANPYDDLVTKATDENLASEDWDTNLQICDKVTEEGSAGARNAVAALVKRLAHRNPNVQIYTLELANMLVQNCQRPLKEEIASRTWTDALKRLVNDHATVEPVQRKALQYVREWAEQFENAGENLGLMGELFEQLRAKNFSFDEPEPAPEDADAARRRQEEEELARVIELSKQDAGRRGGAEPPATSGAGSSNNPFTGAAAAASSSSHAQPSYQQPQPQQSYAQPAGAPGQQPYGGVPPPRSPTPPVDLNTATRVRALYTFTSSEVGELNFERGDIIKVLDRGFKEWWRGACNGKIGIFPVTYVEALPEPSASELQEEAQEEARVFTSLGLVDRLLQTLKGIDTARGDRLEDRPEVQEMYQDAVGLQAQINALIKKYSDQKAELEHMNQNFIRAMNQYEELRGGPAPQQQPYYPQQHPSQDAYGPPQASPYAQHQGLPPAQQHQQQQQPYPAFPQPYPQSQPQSQPQPGPYAHPQSLTSGPMTSTPDVNATPAPGAYYQHPTGATSNPNLERAPSGAPSLPPQMLPRQNTQPGAAGVGAGADSSAEHAAAWDAFYRSGGPQPQGQPSQAPHPAHAQSQDGYFPPQHGQPPQQHQQQPQQPPQQPPQQHQQPQQPPHQGHPQYQFNQAGHEAAAAAAAAAMNRMSVGQQ